MLPIRINASDQVHQGFKCESGSEAQHRARADGCVRGVAALRGRRCIRALSSKTACFTVADLQRYRCPFRC
jgi:hypothetical protein